jgi:hypothetical protein
MKSSIKAKFSKCGCSLHKLNKAHKDILGIANLLREACFCGVNTFFLCRNQILLGGTAGANNFFTPTALIPP